MSLLSTLKFRPDVSRNHKEILHIFCDEMLVHVNSRLSKFILTSSAALKNTFKSIKVDQ